MEKILRSLIHEKFPEELRFKIELLSRRRDIINKEKQEELIKLLREFDIKGVIPLGPGTNRYAFRLDGFVVKVATDHDGKIDNMKEFKMAKRLFPYVTKTYEVSDNGTILVAEYIQPFASYAEMCKYADKIREILTKLSTVYLIGDVGISPINYSNWGLRIGTNDPVCLDFAYVYDVSSELFVCRHCNNGTMLVPNKDFTELLCPNKGCGRKYLFEDIRARLGNDIHRHEIGDLGKEGYRISSSNVLTILDDSRSNYLARKKKQEIKKDQSLEEDEFIDDFNLLNIKEDKDMAIQKFRFDDNGVIAAVATKLEVSAEDVQKAREDLQSFQHEIADETENNEDEFFDEEDIEDDNVAVQMPIQKIGEPNRNMRTYADDMIQVEAEIVFSGKIDDMATVPNDDFPMNQPGITADNHFNNEEDTDDVEAVEASIIEDADEVEEVSIDDESTESVVEVEAIKVDVESTDVERPVRVENKVVETSTNVFNRNFLDNMERAISKLSNRMGNHMHELILFDKVRNSIRDKKMYPDTFYKNLQNAIFRSLMIFCNFTEKDVPNSNGKGYHKEFTAPANIVGEVYEPTMIFISRFWNNRNINSLEESRDIMNAYDETYEDYRGIQTEWLELLAQRIQSKMPIDKSAVETIIDVIKTCWCDVDNQEEVVEETDISDEFEDELEEVEEITTDPDDELVSEDELVEETVSQENDIDENSDDVIFQGELSDQTESLSEFFDEEDIEDDEEDEEDEECDEDDNEEESMDHTYVEIRRNLGSDSKYDLIKLITADDYDTIIIPFYTRLDEIDSKDMPKSMADSRNGVWDWMIHFMTDYRFLTSDPDKWLKINDKTSGVLSIFKFVILDPDFHDNMALMGFTVSYNVIEVDEEGNQIAVNDYDTLAKINKLIINNCAYGEISHLNRSLSFEDIRDENEIEMLIKNAIDNASEMETCDYEEDEEDTEDDEDDRFISEAEAAALAAILNGGKIQDYEDDNENIYTDTEDNDTTKTFTPIRRRG